MTRDEAILHQIVTDGEERHSEGTLRVKWSLIADTIKYQLGIRTDCSATHLCQTAANGACYCCVFNQTGLKRSESGANALHSCL